MDCGEISADLERLCIALQKAVTLDTEEKVDMNNNNTQKEIPDTKSKSEVNGNSSNTPNESPQQPSANKVLTSETEGTNETNKKKGARKKCTLKHCSSCSNPEESLHLPGSSSSEAYLRNERFWRSRRVVRKRKEFCRDYHYRGLCQFGRLCRYVHTRLAMADAVRKNFIRLWRANRLNDPIQFFHDEPLQSSVYHCYFFLKTEMIPDSKRRLPIFEEITSRGDGNENPDQLGNPLEYPPESIFGPELNLSGAESPSELVSGAESPLEPVRGAEAMMKPVRGAESMMKPVRGAESMLGSICGDESPSLPARGAKSKLKPVRGAESMLGPVRGDEIASVPVRGARPKLKAARAAESMLGSVRGDESPSVPVRGARSKLKPVCGVESKLGPVRGDKEPKRDAELLPMLNRKREPLTDRFPEPELLVNGFEPVLEPIPDTEYFAQPIGRSESLLVPIPGSENLVEPIREPKPLPEPIREPDSFLEPVRGNESLVHAFRPFLSPKQPTSRPESIPGPIHRHEPTR